MVSVARRLASRRTAVGATLGALTVLGFALGGRGFAGAIQLQLLAVLAWSAAGGVGVALGIRLGKSDDFADLLAPEALDVPPAPIQPERIVTEP